MGVKEILKLLDAGYTREQIEAMGAEEPPREDPPREDPPREDPPREDPPREPDERDKRIEELQSQIKELQAKAAMTAKQDGPKEKPSAESAIRSFIESL